MRTRKQWLNYKELELISTQAPEPKTNHHQLLQVLLSIWYHLLAALTKGDELRIWQTQDCYGQTWWKLYDPVTGESRERDSSQEVQSWLEEHYYRRSRNCYRSRLPLAVSRRCY